MAKLTTIVTLTSSWVALSSTEDYVRVQWLSGTKVRLAVAGALVDLASGDRGHELGMSVPELEFSNLGAGLVCARSNDANGATIAVTKY